MDELAIIETVKEIENYGEQIRKFIKEQVKKETPRAYVKMRPDGFEYVEEEYIRNELNRICVTWSWDYITHEIISNKAIIFCGRLTGIIQINNKLITRTMIGEGGGVFHFSSSTGNLISAGNPFKSASADALKKAANRLFGIASDIYRKNKDDIIEQLELLKEHPIATSKTIVNIDNAINNQSFKVDDLSAYYLRLKTILDNELTKQTEQKEEKENV